jgi:hypothetical protein
VGAGDDTGLGAVEGDEVVVGLEGGGGFGLFATTGEDFAGALVFTAVCFGADEGPPSVSDLLVIFAKRKFFKLRMN